MDGWMDRSTDRQVEFTRRLHAYFRPFTDCSFHFDSDRFYSVPSRLVSFVRAVRGCSFRAIQRHNLFYFRKLNGSIPTGMRRRRANGRRGESCKRRKNECKRHRSRPRRNFFHVTRIIFDCPRQEERLSEGMVEDPIVDRLFHVKAYTIES